MNNFTGYIAEGYKQKILVTGAAGFIGFHVVNALLDEGHCVVGLDNINDYYDINLKYGRLAHAGINRQSVMEGLLVQSDRHENYRFVKADIVDLPFVSTLFDGEAFDKVIHLAAQAGVRYSIENPHVYVQSNLVGFVNILECCRHHHIRHLVYASSSSVYGNNQKVPFSEDDRVDFPVSLYAATKKSNELMAHTYSHLYRLPCTGLRFFTVYGPWGRPDMAPMLFANAIVKGEPIKVFNNGDMERDFTYVGDIVKGVVKVMDHIPGEGETHPHYRIFNIGNSTPVRLLDFIAEMENALGKRAIKELLPMQAGDVKKTFADTGAIETAVGLTIDVPLHTGIARFVQWFKNYQH